MSAKVRRRMECMEVWGGNHAADASVVMPGLDAWVYSEPHGDSTAGGDVHYVSSCASGRITRFLLADVSGHGESVAEIALDLRTIMRRYINLVDQTTVVRAINEELKQLREAGRMTTAIAATYFLPTRKLTLSNAGHPPPLVYRRRTGRWQLLELGARGFRPAGGPANIPLGIFTEASWEKFELRLRPGDLALVFTDALMEMPVAEGEQLGLERLVEIVCGLDPEEPSELIPRLLAAVRAAAGGRPFDDDTSVMLVRGNQVGTRLVDNLLAPFRYLGDLLRFRRPGLATG